MRAAALQFLPTPFDLARNLSAGERLLRRAAQQGARLAVLPNFFNTGFVYTPRLFAFAETEDGAAARWLRQISAELSMYVAGGLLLRQGEQIHNALILAGPDGALHRYRKRRPFLWERFYFEAGAEPLIVDSELGRLGLMLDWDMVHWEAAEAYRGRVDCLLVSSSAPRFHRALLNFPLGRRVYLAQLIPALLRQRDAIDRWFGSDVAARAAWLGAPIVHGAAAGRFVTELPLPRLSFLIAAWGSPRYWPYALQARFASLRATFYGQSAVFSARGEPLAQAEDEAGYALADISAGAPPSLPTPPEDGARPPLARLPIQLRLVDRLLRPMATAYYRRHRPPS